ncbi:MAG: peptidylprolyl isomerase, partial [Mariprofundus sp.]
GMAIHESDIDAEMEQMPDSVYQYRNDPKTRSQMLDALIRRQVISQKAIALGLHLDPLIRQRIENVRHQILIEAAKAWQLDHMAAIKAPEIKLWYEQHLSDFTVPEQVHARHILVSSEKQAWGIIKKLRAGKADFAALAARQSIDDSNKSRGGDLNWFPRGVMVEAFDKAVFKLKKNGISRPVKTRFGWHVIELLGRREEIRKPLQEVSDEIISILQHQQMQQWYQSLENKSDINILKQAYR